MFNFHQNQMKQRTFKLNLILIFTGIFFPLWFIGGCGSNCRVINTEKNSDSELFADKIFIIQTLDGKEFICQKYTLKSDTLLFTTLDKSIQNMPIPLKEIKEIRRCEAGGEDVLVSAAKISGFLIILAFFISKMYGPIG